MLWPLNAKSAPAIASQVSGPISRRTKPQEKDKSRALSSISSVLASQPVDRALRRAMFVSPESLRAHYLASSGGALDPPPSLIIQVIQCARALRAWNRRRNSLQLPERNNGLLRMNTPRLLVMDFRTYGLNAYKVPPEVATKR